MYVWKDSLGLHIFNSQMKAPYRRNLHVDICHTLIEYENGKAKLALYVTQLPDLEEPDDQR